MDVREREGLERRGSGLCGERRVVVVVVVEL